MASDHIGSMLAKYEGLGKEFTPEYAVQFYRDNIAKDDLMSHIMVDLVEGLHDENLRLKRLLDQSKAKPRNRRRK